ncbi:hypothetical protein C8R46DRAFT_1148235, partial [Mycena filopes]
MSTPTPRAITLLPRSGSTASIHSPQRYPPIYKNLPSNTARDPFGLLPFRRQIQATGRSCILHWSNRTKELVEWEWPVENGQRVVPSDLRAHRITHDFKFPNCLCSVHELDPEHSVECAVFMCTTGRLSGEYVGACAQNVCKYFVFMERLYNKRSQAVRSYPRRGESAPVPPEINYNDNNSEATPSGSSAPSSSQPLRRAREDSVESTPVRPFKRRNGGSSSTAVGNSSPINPFIVPAATPEPLPEPASYFAMLLQLDAHSNAGLTEVQFKKLFVRCSACKLYTTASAFDDHRCRLPSLTSTDVIDLTGEDS